MMYETIFDLNADLRILPFSRLAFRLKVAMGNIKKGFDSITVYCFPAKQKSKFENQQMAFFQLAALYLR